MSPIVLSLCDRTGQMVQPWLEAGYECWIVDVQHAPGETREGRLVKVGADLTRGYLPPRRDYAAAFAFPACTNLAVSGARWFQEKGLRGLLERPGAGGTLPGDSGVDGCAVDAGEPGEHDLELLA
jgi:hypothetical protein